jgi:tetratricopeptide (TPR) repeat protein
MTLGKNGESNRKMTLVRLEQARQQVNLWIQQGDQACLQRQFIRGLRYYHRALVLAHQQQLSGLAARLCRDLAYVYVHHGDPEMALEVIDQGLALDVDEPEYLLGLLVNKVTACLVLEDYPKTLEVIQEALGHFLRHYPEVAGAPGDLVEAYWGLVRMERDLKRVVSLLEAGINPDRIQISVEFARPFWLPASKN